ncbi:hypothetical protein ACT17_06425 [Mycolicibacterium conceptionense]|uniref:Uncharacterized protein n=1 Tax=Mycolicibacterium conceptionense TaxID=451644 RepID=A0A0J8UFI0_9MYCO|nr:hypothetical protein ACT17_06425 [Mycolicibacterium conceptionense]
MENDRNGVLPVTLTVAVYLNDGTDFLRGFDPATALLRKAASFDVLVSGSVSDSDAIDQVLEIVFEQLNIDSPTRDWAQRYRATGNRSLSVGDVVAVGESAWSVARFGWAHVGSSELSAAIARNN